MKINYKIVLKTLLEEHNFINLFWFNFHKIDNQIYRSAQLTPWKLKKIINKYGIKTVINLRDRDNYMYQIEKEICLQNGIKYKCVGLYSRTPNSIYKLKELQDVLLNSPKPILIHCKAGADRTGFAAVFWHIINNKDIKWAINKELRLKYGYIALSKAGLVKEIFTKFSKSNEKDFIKWYEKEGQFVTYNGKNFINFIYDRILKRE